MKFKMPWQLKDPQASAVPTDRMERFAPVRFDATKMSEYEAAAQESGGDLMRALQVRASIVEQGRVDGDSSRDPRDRADAEASIARAYAALQRPKQ